jgi:aromatic ring-cleaving dioxygenase
MNRSEQQKAASSPDDKAKSQLTTENRRLVVIRFRSREGGATDGTRTHDHSDHNRGLYQLSYRRHRWGRVYAKSREARQGLKTLIYRLPGGLSKAIVPLSDFW